MPVRAKRDVEASLKKKGFQQDDGDHHWFFYWTSDGDGLLKEMARQVRISKVQFFDLVDCPMSREQYSGTA